MDIEPEFLNPAHGEPGHVHDDDCGHDHHHHGPAGHPGGHAHEDQDIKGVALTLDRPVDGQKVTRWLNEVLQAQGPDILRAKGILDVKGEARRLVFQAVHMIADGDFIGPWPEGTARASRLVFIGRNLNRPRLRRGFESCRAR